MGKLIVFISGVLFGAGVTISGMVNPMKVLNFFDIFGTWDATLIFVMGAGLLVTLLGYQIIFKRKHPCLHRLSDYQHRKTLTQNFWAVLRFSVWAGDWVDSARPCRRQPGIWPNGKHHICDRHGGRHDPRQTNPKTSADLRRMTCCSRSPSS